MSSYLQPSPPPDASGTLRGLMSTTAQILSGLKTFASPTAGASDFGAKFGTSVADGSVANGFKFASFASGIGGTEAEWARFTRPVGYGGSVLRLLNPASQVNTYQLVMDGCLGVGGLLSYGGSNLGMLELHGGQADSYLQATNRGLTIRQNSNSYDQSQLMRFVVDQTGGVASSIPVFDFVSTIGLQSGQKLMRWKVNGSEVMSLDGTGTLAGVGGYLTINNSLGSILRWGANGLAITNSSMDSACAGVNILRSTVATADQVQIYSATIANRGVLVGSSAADGSVAATTKLLAVMTGLAGTYVEKSFLTAGGEFESAVAGAGVVLQSPNGTRYRLTVTNAGALNIAAA